MKKLITAIMIVITGISITLADTPDSSPIPAPSPDTRLSLVNQKLQDALADTITKATTVAGEAKDFMVEQLPDVIRQLLLWKFFENLLPMVVFGVLTMFMAWRVSALIYAG